MKKILVSNCLLGCDCRYKGDNCRNEKILALAENNVLIGVCPEQAGGLPTPRDPSERVSGRVMSCKGKDVTKEYLKGAEITLYLATLNNVDFCILKANSPSCGKGTIYDGTFTGAKCSGSGTAAELLEKNGFMVFTEDELDKLDL